MSSEQIINSPILWVLSSLMVIASVSQAIIFLRNSLKECDRLGISKERQRASIRSASITALGPSLSPVVTVLALVAVIGAPTAWMRLCDVGAARTELGVVSLMANLTGAEVGSSALDLQTFMYALWGMALNNFGWLFVVFILVHRMDKVVTWMESKYDPKWVKVLMGSAAMALFAYLLDNQLYSFNWTKKWLPAVLGGAMMAVLTMVFKKNQRLQELALGISLLFGILVTQAIVG
jgi:hypothetical protein